MSRIMIKNTAAAGTTLLTVVAPKVCCWSTAFAALSGGTSYLAWVYPMRPYLFALSFLLVGISFYQAYKPAKADECCTSQTKKRTAINPRWMTWSIAIFVLVTFYFSYSQ